MKNKIILALAMLALVALSGCLSENDVLAQMCINMDNTYGVRDLDVCGYEMYDNYQSSFVPDCGAEPRNCDFLDWPCQQCERVRRTFENTGWMATMDGDWQYNLVHYNCYQSGWFNEIYHVSFTTDHVCPEACVPTVRMPNAASAYCAEFLCNVPPENPQYVQCHWPSICDQGTGLCRPFDCRPPYNDPCPPGQTCNSQGQCEGPPVADCSSPGSSFVAQPTEGQTIYGQTPVIVNIESAVCEPETLTVKIDSTIECPPFRRDSVQDGYWVYQCMANADPQYPDGPHTIQAIATKGSNQIRLDRGIRICNDEDAIPHNCIDEPVCPAECTGYDPHNFQCGSFPLQCCTDPPGCRTPKSECGSIPRGLVCGAGSTCNETTWACECSQSCIDQTNPQNFACGTQIPLPPGCPADLCHPGLGTQCPADQGCGQYQGQTACWSGDQITCGTTVSTPQGTITGLYCDALHNSGHKLCDSTISTCVPVAPKNLANSAKYLMDVSTDSQTGMAYNAWFKYRINRADSFAAFDKDKWFGFGYFEQPPLGSAINFTITSPYPVKQSSKEGLVRFEIENAQMSGPQNYVLFNMTDLTNPAKGAPGSQKTEKIIFKLDAGYSGKCVPEDRKFRGQSGATVKPKVNYDWGWGYHSTKMKQCDFNSGIYCDSTQFTIALFDRLQVMSEKAEDGNQAFAASLKEWDANVMKDGFSQDFLLDFNHFENNFAFVGQYALDAPPSWFKGTTLPLWSSYLGAAPNISFSPIQIDSPGRYHVKLDITWHAGEWNFFDASDSPAADIEVQFTKIADAEPLNPLYLMPFDFDVGKNARPGEAAPNRTGYGTNFQGEALPLSDSYSASPTGIGINVTKFSTFAQTNPIERRGKLLAIDLQNNSIVFSPVVATPVAMKLENNSGYAQGFYSLKSGGQEITLDPALSLASWSGIGSKNIGNPASPCKGFHEQPLFFRRSDKAPGEGDNYCTRGTTSTNMRGFWWDGLSGNQTIFVQTVFYAPGESFLVNNYCPQGNMDWVSPTEHLSGALNLNYTASQNLKAGSVSDILNRVLDGTVCQYVSPDKQSVVFYWDRNQLESALDNYDFEQIGLLPENRCNR